MSARHAGSNNIFRLLNVIRAVVPLLRQQGSGHILNISGMVGQFSFPLASIYHATKYAVEGISESLAKEVGAFGIKVTIIEPGAFKTGFAGRSMTYAEPIAAYQPVYETMAKRFEPTGDPARAAQAIEVDVPPRRLALGADALHLVREKLNSELEEYKRGNL
jgi:short-subunit dehydrogenase